MSCPFLYICLLNCMDSISYTGKQHNINDITCYIFFLQDFSNRKTFSYSTLLVLCPSCSWVSPINANMDLLLTTNS